MRLSVDDRPGPGDPFYDCWAGAPTGQMGKQIKLGWIEGIGDAKMFMAVTDMVS